MNKHIQKLERYATEQIKNGDLLKAIRTLEKLVKTSPKNISYHDRLGQVLRQYCDNESKHQQLKKLVIDQPYAYTTRLLVARFDEMLGNIKEAFYQYNLALNTATSIGFWLNDASTAPWCRPFVQHALQVCTKQRVILGQEWIAKITGKYGRNETTRVEKGIRMYTGELPVEHNDKRQLPSYFYVPDLPVAPHFPRDVMPFIEDYEAAAGEIQSELFEVLETHDEFPSFQYQGGQEQLTEGGNWDAFFFYRHGKTYDDNLAQCPKTAKVLANLPLCRIPKHSPEVCFSILRPGAHILPHRGVTNLRSVLHLGLDIPTDCALHLPDIEEIHWEQGKAFAFDDTYLHEAWNRSEHTRIVMLADIWNPYLTDVEQLALTDVMIDIGSFNHSVKSAVTSQ